MNRRVSKKRFTALMSIVMGTALLAIVSHSFIYSEMEIAYALYACMKILFIIFVGISVCALLLIMRDLYTIDVIPPSIQRNEGDEAIDPQEKVLSRAEVCNVLHVDTTTLWRWNKSGFLKNHKIGKRRVVYLYSDVMAVLKTRTDDSNQPL